MHKFQYKKMTVVYANGTPYTIRHRAAPLRRLWFTRQRVWCGWLYGELLCNISERIAKGEKLFFFPFDVFTLFWLKNRWYNATFREKNHMTIFYTSESLVCGLYSLLLLTYSLVIIIIIVMAVFIAIFLWMKKKEKWWLQKLHFLANLFNVRCNTGCRHTVCVNGKRRAGYGVFFYRYEVIY